MTHHLNGLVTNTSHLLSLPSLFFVSLSSFLHLFCYCIHASKLFQKCLGCCGRRWLALHAFADVFQGCYKNGTNGTRDCRYFAGLYLVFRIVLLLAMYSGSVFSMYAEMVAIVCQVITALLFLLFRPYKDNWLNIWDSTVFSLIAFAQFCNIYARYVAPIPITFEDAVLSTVPLIYFIIYVTYKLLIWTKALQMCKKRTDFPILESQEPDRLLHPEEYESEERKPLLTRDEGDNSANRPQDADTETYPACGNSEQPTYRAMYSSLA